MASDNNTSVTQVATALETPWTTSESLILTQTVHKWGEDAWGQVAKALKQHPSINRPSDFLTPKVLLFLRFFHSFFCPIEHYFVIYYGTKSGFVQLIY